MLFTSPPVPLSLRKEGISIAGGHPQSPARGKSLWIPFTTVIARSAKDEEILGVMVGRCDCRAPTKSERNNDNRACFTVTMEVAIGRDYVGC